MVDPICCGDQFRKQNLVRYVMVKRTTPLGSVHIREGGGGRRAEKGAYDKWKTYSALEESRRHGKYACEEDSVSEGHE